MPELPEVQTTVNQLRSRVPGRTITGMWTDWPRIIRYPRSIRTAQRKLKGQRITDVSRRAKYIILELENGQKLYVHQKMSGHLLYGQWQKKGGSWKSVLTGSYLDPKNRFIRLVLSLDNGFQIALADQRRFGKILLADPQELPPIKELQELGPEPLEISKTDFCKLFTKKRGFIKPTLMDPRFIVGIGNIYADEILWETGLHPLSRIEALSSQDIDRIYRATRHILTRAIRHQGSSMDDYRTPTGEKGGFQNLHRAYHRTGELCIRSDGGVIQRIRLGGRSAHFCPAHQRHLT